jgi:hydrogenase nickel incorporation protein HypA/HybF
MHELSIRTYLPEAVEAKARDIGAEKVRVINLVGERTGALDDSLLFYFDMLTPDAVAEGAHLNIRRTYMTFRCDRCDSEHEPQGAAFECPRCGEVGRLAHDASDLLIESMEIERCDRRRYRGQHRSRESSAGIPDISRYLKMRSM